MGGSAAGVQADGVQQAFDERLRQALQEAYRAYDQRLETALRAAAMSANAVESALTRDGESWAKHLKAPEASEQGRGAGSVERFSFPVVDSCREISSTSCSVCFAVC